MIENRKQFIIKILADNKQYFSVIFGAESYYIINDKTSDKSTIKITLECNSLPLQRHEKHISTQIYTKI